MRNLNQLLESLFDEDSPEVTVWFDMDGVLADFDGVVHKNENVKRKSLALADWLKQKPELAQLTSDELKEKLKGPQPDTYMRKLKKLFISYRTTTYSVASLKGHFTSLPILPGAIEMVKFAKELTGNLPNILTAPMESNPHCKKEKKEWIDAHIPGMYNIFKCTQDKHMFAGSRYDILIDDRPKFVNKFRAAGGTAILHKNPERSMQELKELVHELRNLKEVNAIGMGGAALQPSGQVSATSTGHGLAVRKTSGKKRKNIKKEAKDDPIAYKMMPMKKLWRINKNLGVWESGLNSEDAYNAFANENDPVWEIAEDDLLTKMDLDSVGYWAGQLEPFVGKEKEIPQDWAIAILPDGEIEDGFHRLAAAQILGLQQFPVSFWKMQNESSYVKKKSLMLEMSFSEADIPGVFWLIFDMNAEDHADGLKQLADGKLKGVKGIGGDSRIVIEWFDIARNAILVMPGKEVIRLNKLSRVNYDNPHYLVSQDLKALRRLYNKSPSPKGNEQMMVNVMDYFVKALHTMANTPQKRDVLHAITYGWLSGHWIGDIYAEKGQAGFRIKTVRDLSEFIPMAMKTITIIQQGKTFVPPKSLIEDIDAISKKEWYDITYQALLKLGNTYSAEGEWLLKDEDLLIPKRSRLIFLKNNTITPDKIEAFKQDPTKLPSGLESWDVKTLKTIKMISDLGLDKKYEFRFLNRRKYQKARERYWSRRHGDSAEATG